MLGQCLGGTAWQSLVQGRLISGSDRALMAAQSALLNSDIHRLAEERAISLYVGPTIRPDGIRAELQEEIDGWLEDVI